VDGPTDFSGRIEVYYNGQWGTVCDDGFGSADARVACRDLGFGAPISYDDNSGGLGYGRIWLDDLGCSGSELSLGQCSHNPWGSHNCGHGEDVSITCREPTTCTLPDSAPTGYSFASSTAISGCTSASCSSPTITGVSCARGYGGTVATTQCSPSSSAVTLTGCSALGYVDDSSCQWHEMNKMDKVINSNQFFGFECPANQIISDLRLEGYGARSVLENNPTAILCCELGGYSVVTNTCVDSYSTADGVLEAAICQGNSAMAAIYDLSDPSLEQNQWQYQATKGITCCDIEFDTTYGHNRDLGIDRSQCEIISHSNQVGSFDVSCPVDMVLVEIRDNDIAHGVQEVHEIECCRVHQASAPTKAPTITPTTSQPSPAPTSSCYHCLIGVHARDVRDQDDFVGEIRACLSHCCA